MPEAEAKQLDLKKQLEAILFASGRKMSVEEISRLCRTTVATVEQYLQELKSDYELKDSSLLLMDESDGWKLTVREQYTSVVQKIVADTELTKTMIETLAVIAWKAPVLQAGVIKIRTNKAYDHIAALEKSGFITREKHGRSQMIKLTERFFKYFDLKSQEEVKEKFKGLAEKRETLPAMAAEAAPENIETPDSLPIGAADKDVSS